MKNIRISKRVLSILFTFCTVIPAMQAQIVERICQDNYDIDSAKVGELSLKIDNISFFKDNEFKGNIFKGYTLPGFWLQPKVAFYPLKSLKLEAGIHALVYHGAYKFPNYAYQDIARWQGNQYQKGAHLLPYFRAQLKLSNVNLVWGNLYGGSNHQLIEPLYNPELNLTADPETGFQLLWDNRLLHLDIWVDWQSFIFRTDTHQEAFVVGLSSQFKCNKPEARIHAYIPIQATIQHRGGEIDTIHTNSVQTLMNASIGAGITWNPNYRILKQVNIEADAVGYYQQAGALWPLNKGGGLYFKARTNLGNNLRLQGGYFLCKDFISLFGIPFFGSVSTSEENAVYGVMRTAFASIEYSRQFKKYCAMGVKADLYYSRPDALTYPDGRKETSAAMTNFAAGAYFRLNLDILLWKHKK